MRADNLDEPTMNQQMRQYNEFCEFQYTDQWVW